MIITKTELVKAVRDEVGMSLDDVSKVIDTLIEKMTSFLDNGESIKIRDFGVLKSVTRKARDGRNPKTGATVRIPETQTVKFTPSKKLKKVRG